MFRYAIVRRPGKSIVEGLTEAKLGKPDFNKAVNQHAGYVQALKDCGLELRILEASEDYPDSVFVEDVALLTSECAIITNPGAPSRRGETHAIRKVVAEYYSKIKEIQPPGTLDGGDVMRVGKHYYIGLSGRTNKVGAKQFITLLENCGMTGSIIKVDKLLHLKTGVSNLGDNSLVIGSELASDPAFSSFTQIKVPDSESYAANCVWINGKVMVPAGYPATRQKIMDAGYETIAVDVSEFRKLDGGLSCLSLRF